MICNVAKKRTPHPLAIRIEDRPLWPHRTHRAQPDTKSETARCHPRRPDHRLQIAHGFVRQWLESSWVPHLTKWWLSRRAHTHTHTHTHTHPPTYTHQTMTTMCCRNPQYTRTWGKHTHETFTHTQPIQQPSRTKETKDHVRCDADSRGRRYAQRQRSIRWSGTCGASIHRRRCRVQHKQFAINCNHPTTHAQKRHTIVSVFFCYNPTPPICSHTQPFTYCRFAFPWHTMKIEMRPQTKICDCQRQRLGRAQVWHLRLFVDARSMTK
jgi:hypothetical protein